MNNFHLAVSRQSNQQQPLVSIYWDYQNIPSAKLAKHLLIFAGSRGYLISRKVYNNWERQNKKDKAMLDDLMFECVNVSSQIKNVVDFDLSMDCCNEAFNSLYQHLFIIVSGDGYAEILLHKLKDKGKKVIIFARQGNESKNLKKIADEFYFMDELHKLIEAYQPAA